MYLPLLSLAAWRLVGQRALAARNVFDAVLRACVRSALVQSCRQSARAFRSDRCHTLALSDGRTLGYALHGCELAAAKRVVLYYHGLCGSRREVIDIGNYDALVKRGIAWIGVDRPGVGLSTYSKNRTVLGFAADIRELVTALQIDKFSVMGFSSGASYVHATVHEFGPERCITATVVGGQGPYSLYVKGTDAYRQFNGRFKQLKYINAAMANPWLRWLAKLYYANVKWKFVRNPRSATAAFWGAKLIHSDPATRRMLEENSAAVFSTPNVVEALVQDLSLPNKDWGFSLANCKSHYFIHHGGGDKLRPVAESAFTASQLTGARSVTASYPDGIGHSLHLFPEQFNKILDQIISVN